MNRMLIVCGMVAFLAAGSVAYSDGAPSDVCDDPPMKPLGHGPRFNAKEVENFDKNGAVKYTLKVEEVEGNPKLAAVTLEGPSFMGFVLRATTPQETNLGAFLDENGASIDENNVEFNILTCKMPENVALTHGSKDAKTSINLLWMHGNTGKPVFQATVVPNGAQYVLNISPSN